MGSMVPTPDPDSNVDEKQQQTGATSVDLAADEIRYLRHHLDLSREAVHSRDEEIRSLKEQLDRKDKASAALLLRTVTTEEGWQQEKAAHKLVLDALRMKVRQDRNATGTAARESEEVSSLVMLPTKRIREPNDEMSPAASLTKKQKGKVIECVECYKSKIGKHCDDESPCWPCRHRGTVCQRMKCVNFDQDTCLNINCGLAHSDDGFTMDVLVEKAHIKQSEDPRPNIPPVPTGRRS